MLCPIFGLLFLSIIFLLISKKIPILQLAYTLTIKKTLLTILIFNSLNMSFCMGVHYKYSTSANTLHYDYSCILVIATAVVYLAIMVYLQVGRAYHFGDYKDYFKVNCVTRMYICNTLAYRLCLGFYLGVNI